MSRTTLTDQAIKRLPPAPPGKRVDHWDSLVPGLSLRVTANGVKSWTILGRLHGKVLRHTLGSYPALGVAAAREQARLALEQLALGYDPRRSRGGSPTVEKAVTLYCEAMKEGWELKYHRKQVGIGANWITPTLGTMLVDQVERADVARLVAKIGTKYPGAALSVLTTLSGLFRWCIDQDWIKANPCTHVRGPTKVERDRVYTDPELRAIWAATHAPNLVWPYGPYLRFLLATGQRRDQVAAMRWDQIDVERRVWTARTKEKRLHPVPLSSVAISLLTEAEKHRHGLFVWSYTGERGVTNMSYIGRTVRQQPNVPPDFRLHDLRRTAATRMAELGVAPWVVDAVLDHAKSGVTKVYQRYGYLEEMRSGLQLWADRLNQLLSPPSPTP